MDEFAHIRMAISAFESGQIRQAEQACNELMKQRFYPYVAYMLALVRLEQERYKDAETLVRRALDHESDRPEYLAVLGLALLRSDRSVEALCQLRQAASIHPGLWQARYCLANQLVDIRERHAEAHAHLEAILENNPRHVGGWHDLARLHEETGQLEPAVQALGKALKIDPGHRDSRLMQIRMLRKTGALEDALQSVEQALNDHAINAAFYEEQAHILRLLNRPGDSLERISTGLDKCSGVATPTEIAALMMECARAAALANRWDWALQALRNAMEEDPDATAARECICGLAYLLTDDAHVDEWLADCLHQRAALAACLPPRELQGTPDVELDTERLAATFSAIGDARRCFGAALLAQHELVNAPSGEDLVLGAAQAGSGPAMSYRALDFWLAQNGQERHLGTAMTFLQEAVKTEFSGAQMLLGALQSRIENYRNGKLPPARHTLAQNLQDEQDLRQFILHGEPTSKLLLLLARFEAREGRYAEALAAVRSAVRLDEKNAEAKKFSQLVCSNLLRYRQTSPLSEPLWRDHAIEEGTLAPTEGSDAERELLSVGEWVAGRLDTLKVGTLLHLNAESPQLLAKLAELRPGLKQVVLEPNARQLERVREAEIEGVTLQQGGLTRSNVRAIECDAIFSYRAMGSQPLFAESMGLMLGLEPRIIFLLEHLYNDLPQDASRFDYLFREGLHFHAYEADARKLGWELGGGRPFEQLDLSLVELVPSV